MTTAQSASLVPSPPHDPTFWLLGAGAGWRAAVLAGAEVSPADRALTLEPLPGSTRSVTEPSGSFGGVVPPTSAAVAPDGTFFLLDPATTSLRHFDPCACSLQPVPCIGGEGSGPRQFRDPHGLGASAGSLFVCDTGNHRVSVFALRGFTLRAIWAPGAASGLSNPWEPFDIAFDYRGRVFVSDRANGCIHRFHPSGHWDTCLRGFGAVTHLAIDRGDRLYVAVEGEEGRVRVVDTDGRPLEEVSRVEALAGRFPPLPCALDSLTTASDDVRYPTSGWYLSGALDSRFYHCQWHRIVLRGEIPPGSRVLVETHTAEADKPLAHVQALPLDAWETRQTAARMINGEWDCLVRSSAGRFLWLRVTLKSSGRTTPRLDSVRVEFPRISLRRYLPAVFAADPVSADFTDRFLGIFDVTLRSLERHVDRQARLFDPAAAPATQPDPLRIDFLTWLGTWIGLRLDRQMPESKRRHLLKNAARLYCMRGTREGLWRQLLLFLDLQRDERCCAGDQPLTRCRPSPANCAPVERRPCAWQPPPLILEHFQLRRWLFLGAGRLGDQAVLWGKRIVNRTQLDAGAQIGVTELRTTQDPYRDPFHYYAHKFTVFVPASYQKSERRRKAIENLLDAERPAHTQWFLEFVAPRLRIGVQSMIGFDSVVARYPEGLMLNQAALGQASILGRQPQQQCGPALAIGRRARVGTTTLN